MSAAKAAGFDFGGAPRSLGATPALSNKSKLPKRVKPASGTLTPSGTGPCTSSTTPPSAAPPATGGGRPGGGGGGGGGRRGGGGGPARGVSGPHVSGRRARPPRRARLEG